MLIESADGAYETLVKLPDDDVGETWVVKAREGGFATLVRLSAARSAVPSDRNSFVVRIIGASRATSSRVRIPIDRGELEGRPFAVFPYRFDVSLRSLVSQLHARGRRLAPALAASLGASLAEALDEVHDTPDGGGDPMRIVHGAIRSERVRITFAADVELDGLGLAPPFGPRIGASPESIRYVAPETLAVSSVDCRADVFSIAAIVWEALAARRFDRSLAKGPLTKFVPDAPAALGEVLSKALSTEPASRFPSLDDFADALRNAVKSDHAIELRSLSVLAATAIAADVARAPFASDPAVSAALERDRPPVDEAMLDTLTRPIVPGTPADLVDPNARRAVFGSLRPSASLSGAVEAPAKKASRLAPAPTPNPVAAPPVPGSGNQRERNRSSAPPPLLSKSKPPPTNRAVAQPTSSKNAAAPMPPPIPRPPRVPGASVNVAPPVPGAKVVVEPEGDPTIPGGFGAPVVPPSRTPWVKQGLPIPAGAAVAPRRSTPPPASRSVPPPPPPEAGHSATPPAVVPAFVPAPPASLLAAVADSPFAPIPSTPPPGEPVSASGVVPEVGLSGLFGPEDDATEVGARPIDVGSVGGATNRAVAPTMVAPVVASIPLRPDDERDGRKKRRAILAVVSLAFCALVLAGLYKLRAGDSEGTTANVGAPAATHGGAEGVPTAASAPAALDVPGENAAPAGAGDSAAAEDTAEMVFEEPAPPTTATTTATTPMRAQARPAAMRVREEDLSFRERRALRRARRRAD